MASDDLSQEDVTNTTISEEHTAHSTMAEDDTARDVTSGWDSVLKSMPKDDHGTTHATSNDNRLSTKTIKSPFLSLPVEVHEMIIDHLFPAPCDGQSRKTIFMDHGRHYTTNRSHDLEGRAILATCHQMHAVAGPKAYGNMVWYLPSTWPNGNSLLSDEGPQAMVDYLWGPSSGELCRTPTWCGELDLSLSHENMGPVSGIPIAFARNMRYVHGTLLVARNYVDLMNQEEFADSLADDANLNITINFARHCYKRSGANWTPPTEFEDIKEHLKLCGDMMTMPRTPKITRLRIAKEWKYGIHDRPFHAFLVALPQLLGSANDEEKTDNDSKTYKWADCTDPSSCHCQYLDVIFQRVHGKVQITKTCYNEQW